MNQMLDIGEFVQKYRRQAPPVLSKAYSPPRGGRGGESGDADDDEESTYFLADPFPLSCKIMQVCAA